MCTAFLDQMSSLLKLIILTLMLMTVLLVHGSDQTTQGTNKHPLMMSSSSSSSANSHDQSDRRREHTTTTTNTTTGVVGGDHHGRLLHFHDHSSPGHDDGSDDLSNNPSAHVFFKLNDLRVLNQTMTLYFPTNIKPAASKSPHFLPREEADSIPFSSTQLPYLLNHFSIPRDSPQAENLRETLSQCERRPIKGEMKLCATSLESMLGFVRTVFHPNPHFRALTTKHVSTTAEKPHGGGRLVKYRIASVAEVVLDDDQKGSGSSKVVACHSMAYPYAVFYCHYLDSGSKAFRVRLWSTVDDDERVDAVALCHMDTSGWSKKHVSFTMLGIKPGSEPVCHVFPPDNIVWVPFIRKYHGGFKKYM